MYNLKTAISNNLKKKCTGFLVLNTAKTKKYELLHTFLNILCKLPLFKVAGPEVRISPTLQENISMSTAIINGHNTSTEDFTKHVFGGKL